MAKRYSAKKRAEVIADAETHGTWAASKEHGVHHSTIKRWLDAEGRDAPAPADQPDLPAPPAPTEAETPQPRASARPEPVQIHVGEMHAADVKDTRTTPAPVAEPAPEARDQAKKNATATAAQVKATLAEIDTDALVAPILDVCDRRLTQWGADEISKVEREALMAAWGPVIEKWLSGPLEPWHVAAITTVTILGPRIVVARKAAIAHRDQEQQAPDERARERTDEPKLHASPDIHRRLRGQAE